MTDVTTWDINQMPNHSVRSDPKKMTVAGANKYPW